MKLLKLLSYISVFLFLGCSAVYAQHEIDSSEIKWAVPALFDFHDIIHPMWHDAYPNKDIKALIGFVEPIKEKMAKVNEAKLPGILREKEDKWKEGLKELNSAAERYYNAAVGNNEQEMLDAAENLHAKFEMMVRIIRPVTKEVDNYHKILYVIYHKYYPDKKYNDIKNVMDDLITQAEAIINSSLPERLTAKTEDYKKAADKLLTDTKQLKTALESGEPETIDKALEEMHNSYQRLEAVFD